MPASLWAAPDGFGDSVSRNGRKKTRFSETRQAVFYHAHNFSARNNGGFAQLPAAAYKPRIFMPPPTEYLFF
jgi:hypothetical protein